MYLIYAVDQQDFSEFSAPAAFGSYGATPRGVSIGNYPCWVAEQPNQGNSVECSISSGYFSEAVDKINGFIGATQPGTWYSYTGSNVALNNVLYWQNSGVEIRASEREMLITFSKR